MASLNTPMQQSTKIFIVFYLLHHIRFFNFTLYTDFGNILSVLDGFYALYFFVFFTRYLSLTRHRSMLETTIIVLYIVFLASIFIGISNGQSPLRIAKWYSPSFLQFGFIFYLLFKKVDVLFLFNILKRLFIAYCIITILCYLQYPDCWFGRQNEDLAESMRNAIENRGLIRFYLPCKMLVPLFLFYYAFNFKQRNSAIKLLLTLLFLLLIGNRFPLAVSAILLSIIIFTSRSIARNVKIKLTIMLLFFATAFLYIPFTKRIINALIELSTSSGADGVGDENIRLLAVSYFFNFNDGNILRTIIGNGIQCYGNDSYSSKLTYANEVLHLWQSDVGFCLLFVYFGIIGLFAYFWWCFACLNIKTASSLLYIKFYFIFLMICMICGGYWFENFYIVTILSYFLIRNNETYKTNT